MVKRWNDRGNKMKKVPNEEYKLWRRTLIFWNVFWSLMAFTCLIAKFEHHILMGICSVGLIICMTYIFYYDGVKPNKY